MFTEYQLEQKEKAFLLSELRFKRMNDFYTLKTPQFKDNHSLESYIFITIARFINYKEDIWLKNKTTKNISTNFSKEILDEFIFNGIITPAKLDFKNVNKRSTYKFKPVEIKKILLGKETDSIWIIDNIRDSIAHGHYYVDLDNETIEIKNNHPDRLLHCSLNYELFLALNELITEERIGGYSNKTLTTVPLLYLQHDLSKPIITNISSENNLRDMFNNKFKVCYCTVKDIFEEDNDKKYDDLTNFYNYNIQLLEKMEKSFQGINKKNIKEHYTKEMKKYIEKNMKKYDIEIYCDHLCSETIENTINYLKEIPNFYNKNIQDQMLIIHKILKSIISKETLTIERGIADFAELYSLYSVKISENNMNLLDDVENIIFSNVNAFRENKKLANLFILAINNFVSNKESIYDKYFDTYEEFNLDNFEFQDYSEYDKMNKKLTQIDNDILRLNNAKINAENTIKRHNDNLLKAPTDKHKLIKDNINNLEQLIINTETKINELTIERNNIINILSSFKTDSNGNYLNNNNKSFFNHIRNAFAHNHVNYLDDRLVYNRKLILEDYDDNNNLTFRCIGRYYDFVKLFNNDLFIEAINNILDKNKTLKKCI